MPSKGFLYRRLARYLPCVFPHVGNGRLSLHDKYDIASVRDVFMSSHYWRAFEHLTAPPKLVVDLGAHCGHFSVLCHIGFLERFGEDTAQYILFEALPLLVPHIHRVVDEAGIGRQVKVVQGLVGRKEGTAGFELNSQNLLSSRALPQSSSSNGPQLSYRDLDAIIPAGTTIDILKVDIEGSEFDLLANYRHILQAAKLLLMEVHGTSETQLSFEQKLVDAGLVSFSPAIVTENERLICHGNKSLKNLS